MISEWPILPDAARPARPGFAPGAPLRDSVAADARRLDESTTDLFLDPVHRLSDQVRALAWTMRDMLVQSVERDLRLFLASRVDDDALGASLSSASVAIALPLLAEGDVLRHPSFAAALLRRAREAVAGDHIVGTGSDAPVPLLDDDDPHVAAAAMALLVAAGRRRDRFGAPVLLLDDLSAELAAWLAWRVAAALRHYLRTIHGLGPTDADDLLTPAVASVLATHDEGRGLNAVAVRLAACLAAAERIDGVLLGRLLGSGNLPAFTAVLAAAVRLPDAEVWTVVGARADERLSALLRAAGVARAQAAAILLILDEAGAEAALNAFDALDPVAARRLTAPLGLDAGYRAAIAAVDSARALAGEER